MDQIMTKELMKEAIIIAESEGLWHFGETDGFSYVFHLHSFYLLF